MSASLIFADNRIRFLTQHARFQKLFSCESAQAVVWRDDEHTWNAEYSGVLSQDCFADLRASVVYETRGAKVTTMHMGRALMAFNVAPPIYDDTYAGSRAPGAMVVRPDQYDVWRDYAGQMANRGIIRVVFLTSQLPQARRWTDRFAIALD